MKSEATHRILLGMAAVVLLLGAANALFAQCAMCRTTLLGSPEGQKLAAGFKIGILFLLGAPFAITSTLAFLIFKACRRRPFRPGVEQSYAPPFRPV